MKTAVIIIAAFLVVVLVGFWATYRSLKNIETEKAQLADELVKTKAALAKAEIALKEAQVREAEAKARVEQEKKAKVEEEVKAKVKALEERIRQAIAKKGQGVEHTFINWLTKISDKVFGLKGSAKDIKKWAQKNAERIAVLSGYVDLKTRKEVRIRGKGGDVAFPLEIDATGKVIKVEEYKKDSDGKFKFVIARELASDYGKAKFLGDTKGRVQSYEYIFTPK